MRVFSDEFRRLKAVESFVADKFDSFGVNKRQEAVRLLYEISKRDNVFPPARVKQEEFSSYELLKKYLLQERFPHAYSQGGLLKAYLPKIDLNPSLQADLSKKEFYPKNIFVEKKASASYLARRLKNIFSKANFQEIESFKDYESANRRLSEKDYNKRRGNLFIVNQEYDFLKRCPCTNKALGCGYSVLNLGFGCIYECSYCYLQDYVNSPGIILPANPDNFFDSFNAVSQKGLRLGSGEFTDSLALDAFTEYSLPIIEFFRKQRRSTFEFKTKSVEIKNILKSRPAQNVVISWSLNPQRLINENEFFSAPLKERLAAAQECVRAGYKVGFHFDPIIYFKGWEKSYMDLIDRIFVKVKPEDIAWISLGTFRFSPGLKKIIEQRFPRNKILNEELLLGFDNKLRYPEFIRYNIYNKMLNALLKHSPKLNVYLCMEERLIWQKLSLRMPKI